MEKTSKPPNKYFSWNMYYKIQKDYLETANYFIFSKTKSFFFVFPSLFLSTHLLFPFIFSLFVSFLSIKKHIEILSGDVWYEHFIYIYFSYVCAPSRHYYSSNKHSAYTYICQATRRDYVFLNNKRKKNNNEKKKKKKRRKRWKNAIVFEGSNMDFSFYAQLVQSFFFSNFFVHCLLDNFLHILFHKIFMYIFLFLHKLLRNTIITHGKYSLSTTIFFLFTNCLKYRVWVKKKA